MHYINYCVVIIQCHDEKPMLELPVELPTNDCNSLDCPWSDNIISNER